MSTSFVKFTPLIGAQDSSQTACYLLEIDSAKILLDCGWNFDNLDEMEAIKKIAPTIDAVLLSHADLDHLGGYAIAVAKFGLDCPCFATTPVHDMGLQLLQDVIASKLCQREEQELTLEEANKAFGKITLLRYSQPYTLSGACAGIIITAFGAGHTIGGTIWKVKKDNEEIIYALDFNHRKENHLNGTVLLSTESLQRPSLLIIGAHHTPVNETLTRKDRDLRLINTISERLAANGSLMIPVQTSTRILELAYTLDEHWKKHKLSFHLIFLSHQSQSTMVYAKSMLEWMGDAISQNFQSRDQPFDFRYLKCYQSLDELNNLSGPKVILASFPGLDFGLGHELFVNWASDPSNCVLFPETPPVRSLGGLLFDAWMQNNMAPTQLNQDLNMELRRRIPLEGEELDKFLEAERIRKEAEKEANAKNVDIADMSDSDEEVEDTGTAGVPVYDIYVKDHVTRKGFFKQSQAFRMYPVHEVRNRVDDYGEVFDSSAFTKFEQKVPEDDYMDMDVEVPKPEEIIAPATPSKYIVEEITLKLRCFVHYIDFEGRSDTESIKNIIQQLSPRKLMIVHGSKEATTQLQEYCFNSETITNEIFTPVIYERVAVSNATNLYQVVLTDSLVSSLRLSTLNEYNLAYVSGVIRSEENAEGHVQLFLDPLPAVQQKQRKAVAVGDVKLSELKKHLTQQGFTAQFAAGGVLVINDRFVIQKNAQGNITVDGRVHPEYYKLRKVVYAFQALLQ